MMTDELESVAAVVVVVLYFADFLLFFCCFRKAIQQQWPADFKKGDGHQQQNWLYITLYPVDFRRFRFFF